MVDGKGETCAAKSRKIDKNRVELVLASRDSGGNLLLEVGGLVVGGVLTDVRKIRSVKWDELRNTNVG